MFWNFGMTTRRRFEGSAAVKAAQDAYTSNACACKSGIAIKVACFFSWFDLDLWTTGDVK
jgi:hypothetical protein